MIAKLLQLLPELACTVSCTTRPKRPSEQEGEDYYFWTQEAFLQGVREGKFLEWAKVHNAYYGTLREELQRVLAKSRTPLLEVDVQGAKKIHEELPQALLLFVVPSSLEKLKERLTRRQTETQLEIARRLQRAREEVAESGGYDAVIYNDDLEKAVQELKEEIERYLEKR